MPRSPPCLRPAALLAALLLGACGSHRQPAEPARLPAAVCLAKLDELGVKYDRSSAPDGPCPVNDAVRVSATGLAFSRPTLMSCDLALKIEQFSREVVAPAAQQYFHTTVRHIDHLGAYSCRGRPGGEWSEHSKCNAFDIAGFTFATGMVIRVAKDWDATIPRRKFARAAADDSGKIFGVVLTPDTNSDHRMPRDLDAFPWKKCDAK